MENKKYEKGTLGWLREQQKTKAKKDGFENIDDWLKWKADPFNILEKKYGKEFADWARQNKSRVPNYWLNAGCKTDHEYRDYRAELSEFGSYKDKRNIEDWESGKRLPTNPDNNFVRQSYNAIIKRHGKDFTDSWLKSIKKKIEENKEDKEIDWIKDIEEKYGKEFADYARENKDKLTKRILAAGCKTETEYSNVCAQKRGFKNDSERSKIQGWNRDAHQPMSKNKNCPSNFGVELGEKIIGRYALPILFGLL